MNQVSEIQYSRYLKSLLEGDKVSCSRIINQLLDQKVNIKDLYLNLLQRSMVEVGTLWEENKISIAGEHLASAITENLLNLIYPTLFSIPRTGHKAVICCVPMEYHQIGAKMVADIFELNGWDGYFLGANTPSASLIEFLKDFQPQIVGLSISLVSRLRFLEEMITEIQSRYNQAKIIVGGQGFQHGALKVLEKFPNVRYIPALLELEKLLKQSNQQGNNEIPQPV